MLTSASGDIYHFGDWSLDVNRNLLIKGDVSVELEHRHCCLLLYLLHNNDRVLSREEILKAVWPGKVVNDESVAVAISQLRKLFDDNPRKPSYIKTIPGVGYQFIFPTQLTPVTRSPQTANRKLLYAVFALAAITILVGIVLVMRKASPAPVQIQVAAPSLPADDRLMVQAVQHLAVGDEENLRSAIKLYRQAIANQPQNGRAYLGMAEAKIKLLDEHMVETDNYLEITALLNKALELDPSLARAHLWLAELFFLHDFSASKAEQHFKAAVALAPNDDLIRHRYGHFLFIYKRFSESREQIAIARGLNPLSFSTTSLVWIYLLQGNYDLAAHELDRIEKTEETDQYFKIAAQNVYYQLGDEKKTYANMQWFFKRANFSEAKIATLDEQFQRGGLKAVYQWLLDTQERADIGQYTPPISWARYAIAVGDKKAAMNYLEQAFAKRQAHVECAVADPHYSPLKDEPRFKEFLAKFGGSADANVLVAK